jgi:hypothetical protein
MKLRWWYGIVFNMILAALVVSGAAFYTIRIKGHRQSGGPEQSLLVIKDQDSGRVYGKWPLEEGDEFAIEFVHSVNKTPVRDFFRNEGGMIAPFATRFYSLGAGMQSVLEEGQTLSRDGDALVITGFTVSYKELYYIVGTVSDHLLEINGETVSLRDLCGRNAHITLRIE